MRLPSPIPLVLIMGIALAGCAGEDPAANETEPPILGECKGRGCVSTTQGTGRSTPASGGGATSLPGATFGPAPLPEAPPAAPAPGSTIAPTEITLGGRTGLGAGGPLTNPNTTGPGFGGIPLTGPGPGVGPGFNGAAPTIQPGPVCPLTQPTTGAPCDPIANSFACTYGQRTCMCSMTWNCF